MKKYKDDVLNDLKRQGVGTKTLRDQMNLKEGKAPEEYVLNGHSKGGRCRTKHQAGGALEIVAKSGRMLQPMKKMDEKTAPFKKGGHTSLHKKINHELMNHLKNIKDLRQKKLIGGVVASLLPSLMGPIMSSFFPQSREENKKGGSINRKKYAAGAIAKIRKDQYK